MEELSYSYQAIMKAISENRDIALKELRLTNQVSSSYIFLLLCMQQGC